MRSRRQFLALVARGVGAGMVPVVGAGCTRARVAPLRLACFAGDVTVPLGHGMMGGAWLSTRVADPLEARGFVLLDRSEAPVVFVSVDWCEIRNEAYARWQEVLAEAAGTTPERVMISTVHQHDAPVADLVAESLLRSRGLEGTVCDPAFHEVAVGRVADALRQSLRDPRPVSHVGTGRGRVVGVASNRRYLMPDGQVRFDRTSATRNAFAIEADEGLIDPWLATLSFWDGGTPLAAAGFYAVHPMSYYGQGEVSADFPGLARRRWQADLPGVHAIYVSGASGNVTAGKYNTGARENRPLLAGRLVEGMKESWGRTVVQAVDRCGFRVARVAFEPRGGPGFTEADLEAALRPETRPFQQCLAAMGLSWRRRVAVGRPVEVPCLEVGAASLLLLPGESYVDFQLAAQSLRPDRFVCVAGYGDGATGYVPTERHRAEGDSNLGDWCWVAPGSEARLRRAMAEALGAA